MESLRKLLKERLQEVSAKSELPEQKMLITLSKMRPYETCQGTAAQLRREFTSRVRRLVPGRLITMPPRSNDSPAEALTVPKGGSDTRLCDAPACLMSKPGGQLSKLMNILRASE